MLFYRWFVRDVNSWNGGDSGRGVGVVSVGVNVLNMLSGFVKRREAGVN